jgi:hypothetical protein
MTRLRASLRPGAKIDIIDRNGNGTDLVIHARRGGARNGPSWLPPNWQVRLHKSLRPRLFSEIRGRLSLASLDSAHAVGPDSV